MPLAIELDPNLSEGTAFPCNMCGYKECPHCDDFEVRNGFSIETAMNREYHRGVRARAKAKKAKAAEDAAKAERAAKRAAKRAARDLP